VCAGEDMCTVPRENGAFRDSAHKGLQLLQEKKVRQNTLIYFIPSTQLYKHMRTHTHTHTHTQQLNTSNCVLLYNYILL